MWAGDQSRVADVSENVKKITNYAWILKFFEIFLKILRTNVNKTNMIYCEVEKKRKKSSFAYNFHVLPQPPPGTRIQFSFFAPRRDATRHSHPNFILLKIIIIIIIIIIQNLIWPHQLPTYPAFTSRFHLIKIIKFSYLPHPLPGIRIRI